MRNKYAKHAKISEAKFRQIVKLFCLDLTARQIAEIIHLNRNTVNKYLKGIRTRCAEYCTENRPQKLAISKEVKSNEHLSELIGISVYNKKVYVFLIPEEYNRLILVKWSQSSFIRKYLSQNSCSAIDLVWHLPADNRLSLIDPAMPARLRKMTSNRLTGFIGYCQNRLAKFKGLHHSTLLMHIKECEFRFNYNTHNNLYHLVLKIIRNDPLF